MFVTLSRPLPMPDLRVRGQTISYVVADPAKAFPAGAVVHCATALDPVDAADIARMPESMQLIANIGVGVDHIDLAAAEARGIKVSNTPVVTEDTADLAFGLILASARRMGEGERFLRAGKWAETGTFANLGTRVNGAALGLIGFGPIARAVARRAAGFNMRVRYWNRTRHPEAEVELGVAHEPDLDTLLGKSDIVSIHTALVPATRNLITADKIARMRPGAILINSARGGIVDEAALAKALRDGQLASAGVDVFPGEPLVSDALLACENLVLTPHIGSATTACRADMVRQSLSNIASFLETGVVLNPAQPT